MDNRNNFSSRHALLSLRSKLAYRQKVREALIQNAEHFVTSIGITQVAFITLTLPFTLRSKEELERRFRSFSVGFLSRNFGAWLRVVGRHRSGGLHLHLLADCEEDIATGDPEHPNPHLRSLRRNLKEALPGYRLGFQHRFLPVRSALGVALYLGGQLGDAVQNPASRRSRVVSYSKHAPRCCGARFNWNTEGTARWRELVGQVAAIFGCPDMPALAGTLGPRWAFRLTRAIDEDPSLTARINGYAAISPDELDDLRVDLRSAVFHPGTRRRHGFQDDLDDR